MKEISAETRIRRRDIEEGRYMGASLRDVTMRDLARSIAEQLMRVTDIREYQDPATGDLVVRASVYVAEPGERVSGLYGRSPVNFEAPRFEPSFVTEMMLALPEEELPPATLTREKVLEAVELMKKQMVYPVMEQGFGPIMVSPIEFIEDRMTRKRAAADGEASAVAKARGEREVRENTKKRGVELKIEVGVRKITMPEKEEGTG